MNSDYSILLKRITRLSQALMISGVLNIGVLSLLLYWVLKERPAVTYCELKPASHEQQQISLGDIRGCTEVLAQLSQLTFHQLINRLSSTQMIEDGYAERDLALACLTTFHYFDIQRALPKNIQSHQKRLFAWKLKAQDPPITLAVYPELEQHHFDALIQFAKTEQWPLTSEGLFLLLQSQKEKIKLNDNLIETFVLTPEFWTVELLFNRSGQRLNKIEILTLLLEGNWTLLKQFVEQQRQLQDSSDARRQKFLLDYLKNGSQSAAILLVKMDWDFAAKKLDDHQVIMILELMPAVLPESETFAKEMLKSPRSTNVWKKSSQWLYLKAGESVPNTWDYQMDLSRFILEKSEKGTESKLTTPSIITTPVLPLASKPTKTSPIKPASPPSLSSIAPAKSSRFTSSKEPLTPNVTIKPAEIKLIKPMLPSPSVHQVYVVQEGDTLWKIARRFGVKIEDIRSINQMQSNALKPGISLKIPSGKEKKS